jgi:hypothetical protein
MLRERVFAPLPRGIQRKASEAVLLMIAAGIAVWFIGVEAAGRSLADVARPLTADEAEEAGRPA